MKKENTTTPEVKLICGKTESEIRKAYFKNTVNELLADIQTASMPTEAQINELMAFLEGLKENADSFTKRVLKTFGGAILGIEEEVKIPTTEELYSELSKEDLKTWQENVDKAKKTISAVRAEMAEKAKNHIRTSQDEWADNAIVVESLKRWLAQHYIYLEQLYLKRLTELIDKNKISRREAEDRSKLVPEFSNYKNALKEYESVSELILLYKKKACIN